MIFSESENSQIKSCDVYMISDSSGETASVVLRAIESQLCGVKLNDFLYPLVKTHEQIDDIIKLAKENNVILFKLPAHTSHLVQPLDVGVFKTSKAIWKKILGL